MLQPKESRRSLADSVTTTSAALLRWDTSSLPDSWVATSAVLRLHVVSARRPG